MAAKLIITIAILACVQGVFPFSLVAEEQPVVIVDPPPPPPQCGANEQYSVCGNLCEDNCDNICDAPVLQWFRSLDPSTNTECQAGCYCNSGLLRNRDGDCVVNTPTVCGQGEVFNEAFRFKRQA
jgi:Trypsin Inhibitor like cysteine rich domain